MANTTQEAIATITAGMTHFQRGLFIITLMVLSLLIFTLEVFWLQHIVTHFVGSHFPLFFCVLITIMTDYLAPKQFRLVLITTLVIAQSIIWFV